jgi:hypothetical protein
MTHKGHTQKGYATYASFYPQKVITNMRLTQAVSLIIGYLCIIRHKLLIGGQLEDSYKAKSSQTGSEVRFFCTSFL